MVAGSEDKWHNLTTRLMAVKVTVQQFSNTPPANFLLGA